MSDEVARLIENLNNRIKRLEDSLETLEYRIYDLEREDRHLQGQIDDCVREWEVER